MITGTKHIMGVPAAQRQSRDRQQRNRQGRRKSDADSEDPQQETRGAAIIRIKARKRRATGTAADPPQRLPRHPSSKKRKQPHVDIRI
ncbi:MAG: hypothetical protein P8010_16350 [Desulfosarcinaceae bacterium]